MNILYYQSALGVIPVKKYIDGLTKEEKAQVQAALEMIEKEGLSQTTVHVRPIAGKLWEIKIGSQRLFYVLVQGPTLVLLHAYVKKSKKAPKKEIELAQKRMKEILSYFEEERRKV